MVVRLSVPGPPRCIASCGCQDSTNHDQLEHCWEQAAQLAINYQRHRMKEVVNTVSERLQDIGRHQAAGELHESIDDSQVGGRGAGTELDNCTTLWKAHWALKWRKRGLTFTFVVTLAV